MAGKFTQAAHLWREMTQIEFRVKRWHKKYEILNYIESSQLWFKLCADQVQSYCDTDLKSRGTNFWDTL